MIIHKSVRTTIEMANLLLGLILAANLMGHENPMSFGLGIMVSILVVSFYVLQTIKTKVKSKKCEKCAELILKDALVCKHCHSET